MTPDPESASPPKTPAPSPYGAVPFILPFLVVLGLSTFYPSFAPPAYETEGQLLADQAAPSKYTFWVSCQFILGLLVIGYFLTSYLRQFPFRVSPLAPIVGLLGCGLWIWICDWGIEKAIYPQIGLGFLVEVRPAFDPFSYIENPAARAYFLFVRFGLLALIIPIVEELLVRGWLVRNVQDPDWEQVRLKSVGAKALLAVIAYAVLTHPSEAIAAIAWFSLVNWLMKQTGSIWDCIVAHAVTNLFLGLYVVYFAEWQLW